MGRAPAHREFHLGEDGEGLSGGDLIINIFSELGVYAGRFKNITPSTARMNNPSPNLTNVYVATPPVGPTPELLEYAPPPGCIGLTHGYPHTITGGVPHAGALKSPPLTHPCLPGHTHRCIPPLVGGNHAGSFKKNHKCKIEGNPLKNISQGLERPKPPTHTPWHRGGGVRGSEWETTGPNNFSQV